MDLLSVVRRKNLVLFVHSMESKPWTFGFCQKGHIYTFHHLVLCCNTRSSRRIESQSHKTRTTDFQIERWTLTRKVSGARPLTQHQWWLHGKMAPMGRFSFRWASGSNHEYSWAFLSVFPYCNHFVCVALMQSQ